jgi:ABC-type transport system, involved in lipoprotein release, permease component
MWFYVKLAWRNIWRHRRRTIIVITALGLGIMMMVFYDGMISGFQDAIYGSAIKVLGGNIRVHAAGYSESTQAYPLLALANDQQIIAAAEKLPEMASATRRINTGGMATNTEGAFAVQIIGIDPENELKFNPIAQHVSAGRYLTGSDEDAVFIGKGLATMMNLKVNDRFTLVGQSLHDQMRQRTMTVVGIYDLNVPSIEQKSVYISLNEAQTLYDLTGQSTEVMLTLKQIGQEGQVTSALRPVLGSDETQTWAQAFPELQTAIQTKSNAMQVFSFVILLIAGIGVLNLLLMAVYERTREIGLLGAMGMKPRQIMILFIWEGIMLGLLGAAVGEALGIGLNAIYSVVGFDFSAFAGITDYMALISGRVYTGLALSSLLTRGLPVVIITILASLIPAREASQQEPSEALHYV